MNNIPQWVAKTGSRVPLIITHGVTFFCYFGYLLTYLLPCLLGKQLFFESEISEQQGYFDKKRALPLCILIHIFFLLYMIAFYRTIFTHAGTVPLVWREQIEREIEDYFKQEKQIIDSWRDEQRNTRPSNVPLTVDKPRNDEETSEVNFEDPEQRNDTMDQTLRLRLNIQAKIELLDKRGRRFCKRCQCMKVRFLINVVILDQLMQPKVKPSRTHHCSQCQECLLKMDHHCSFVNNCVGFQNYKYFLNMLFFACGLLIIILYTYTPMFKKAMKNPEIPDQFLFFIALYYEFTWILGIILVGFSLFHIILLVQNKTTLEYLENKADAARGDYDQGLSRNIQAVLGTNCILWCIPAYPNLKGEGVNYMREQSSDV